MLEFYYDKQDEINHPTYYKKGDVECIDAIKAAVSTLKGFEAVCTANVIKYMWRWKEKGGSSDLKKAKWYLDCLIKEADKPHVR